MFLFPRNVNFPPRRGDSLRVFEIARMTFKCGHRASVFYLDEKTPFRMNGVDFYPIRGKITADSSISETQSFISVLRDFLYFFTVSFIFARRISKREKTILYAHTPVGGLVGMLVKVFLNLELVYDPHDWFYETWAFSHKDLSLAKQVFVFVFYKAAASLLELVSNVFVCVSESMICAVKARPRKVLIPNTFEAPASVGKIEAEKGLILFVGHVAAYQGVLNLIKAFALLERKLTNVKLFVVGDGEAFELAQQLSEKLGVRKITFTGAVPHEKVYYFIGKAEVCVAPFLPLPLMNTSSPIKLLEYMAFDKKIVATDLQVLRKMLSGYEKAFFAQATPESLAQSIESALREKIVNKSSFGGTHLHQQGHVQETVCTLYQSL